MKSTGKKVFLSLCIAACMAFIWINSILPAETSGELSGTVEKILRMFFGENFILRESVIRKLAHCFEFAVFGMALSIFLYDKLTEKLSFIAFCGLGTAVCDETIQLFSAGRASQVRDIWIDFTGFTAGVTAVFLLKILVDHWKGTHKKL